MTNAHRARWIGAAVGALLAAGLACSAPGGEGTTPTALPQPPTATVEAPAATSPSGGGEAETPGAPVVGACNPPAPDASIPDGASWPVYCSDAYGFAFRYPPGGAPPAGATGHGDIYLPIAAGTNLIEKYLVVTTTASATTCASPNSEGHDPGSIPSENVTFNGINFIKQSASEGAAGNFYDWVGYSDLSGTLCLSLTFILHSSDPAVFATPPAAFDKAGESAVFEQIMATFIWPTP